LLTSASILYIEDDESLAQLVKRRISKVGHQVLLAQGGRSALETVNNQQFDLLIIDYQLPEFNGLQLIEQLTGLNSDTPIIMVSGQNDIHVAVQALNLGCMDYLIKDGLAYLDLLPVRIQTVLERRQLLLQKQHAESESQKAQASLARAQHLAKIGNWEWIAGENSAWWSEEEFEIFGLNKNNYPDGVSLKDYLHCIHPDDRNMVVAMEEKALQGQTIEFDYRLLLAENELRWIHAIINAEIDDTNFVRRFYGTSQDITDKRESEYQLMLAQRVFDSTTEAIMIADAKTKVLSVNPAFTRITGYQPEEILGQKTSYLKSGKHDASFYQSMWETLNKKGAWSGEIWNRNKQGEIYPEWLSISVIFNHHGEIDQYVSIFSDISQHKKAEKIIEYQANYDALTDLPNRNLFNDRLTSAVKRADRDKNKLALLFIDLDRFKWVNDTMGHRTGDQLLQETAKRLSGTIRDSDSVSRLGGDEFTIVLNDLTNALDAEVTAEKILAQLALPYQLDEKEVFISGSIGITIYPDDAQDIESLYRTADTAMYAAKESGRNRFSFFTATMQKQAEDRLFLLNELQAAIKNQDFQLCYQPVMHAASGEVYGAEALLRWKHRELGFISPAEFIPLAEETGLIQPLGEWVITEALSQMKKWQDAGYKLHIAVNKSSKQFQSDECAEDLTSQIDALGVEAEYLTVEITETVLMEQSRLLTDLLSNYRKNGLKVSLDDFGTGYSSLSYLRQFPFDVLKIDRSFIQNINENKEDATLVETIMLMGHNLGLTVLAEGVETEEQRQFLVERGCNLIQGYLFSPAISAHDFEQQYLT
jgi:diguanylate cyclase (GGDEF)-like protein/PAS domain S-box-containing protein